MQPAKDKIKILHNITYTVPCTNLNARVECSSQLTRKHRLTANGCQRILRRIQPEVEGLVVTRLETMVDER